MPVLPGDFHGVASRLWSGTPVGKNEEICVRTVAGKAYYAAYHCAREAMRAAYNQPDFDVQHGPLTVFMLGSGDSNLRLAGNSLKELREAREIADYDLSASLDHSVGENLVDSAQELLVQAAVLEAAFKKLLPRKP